MPDGERVRQNFKQQSDALARRAKLDIQALNRPTSIGFKQTRLTDEQLGQAESAFLKLDGQSLIAAVDYYLVHGCTRQVQIIVKEAVKRFHAAKETQKKLRPRTRKDYLSRTECAIAINNDIPPAMDGIG